MTYVSDWLPRLGILDRKSTRLNSSHPSTSYAVFCLKKKRRNAPLIRGQRSTGSKVARTEDTTRRAGSDGTARLAGPKRSIRHRGSEPGGKPGNGESTSSFAVGRRGRAGRQEPRLEPEPFFF